VQDGTLGYKEAEDAHQQAQRDYSGCCAESVENEHWDVVNGPCFYP